MSRHANATPNEKNEYQVTEKDLPLHCPTPEMSLWNSHPRVFLPVTETGSAKCPYCGAVFNYVGEKHGHH
ncbi:hypothetical protein BegalDRAFT_1121 [Beggiatoa alba B18LD]|uniref:Zinc finger CHCC-type domain-containing protein n=2 Tax=Beggiatoa alba TaxID=1022 RepID=I3CEI0_9GAMM|nr:hypothetical protein BegalDRAFT_1121 [Beggiatoa alba B18LD]